MIVAIDGPAGAGKSTVARRVAQRLGFQLLDTGALYRTVAWAAREQGVAWTDESALAAIAEKLSIRFELDGDINTILLEGPDGDTDLTRAIRTPDMGDGASTVSALPEVRTALMALQRGLGRRTSSVIEGRDIGTVVFPDAGLKVFLTASPDERARRRWQQLIDGSDDPSAVPSVEAIADEIRERDRRDSTRAIAPLRPADDAIQMDATAMSADEVVDAIVALVKDRT